MRTISYPENDEGVGEGDPRNAYETLKAIASLLPAHNLELITVEDGGDHCFCIAREGIFTGGEMDGAMRLIPAPDDYDDYDDSYSVVDPRDGIDAAEEADEQLANYGLELVFTEGDFSFLIEARQPTVEIATVQHDLADIFSAAGLDPVLGAEIEKLYEADMNGNYTNANGDILTAPALPVLPATPCEIEGIELVTRDEINLLLADPSIPAGERATLEARLLVLP